QIADFLLAETDTYIETFDTYETELTALIEEIEPHLKTDEEIQLMNELKNNDNSINNTFRRNIIPSIENNQTIMARNLRETTYRFRSENIDIVNQLMDITTDSQEAAVNEVTGSMEDSRNVLTIANVSSIIIGISLIILVSGKISRELK